MYRISDLRNLLFLVVLVFLSACAAQPQPHTTRKVRSNDSVVVQASVYASGETYVSVEATDAGIESIICSVYYGLYGDIPPEPVFPYIRDLDSARERHSVSMARVPADEVWSRLSQALDVPLDSKILNNLTSIEHEKIDVPKHETIRYYEDKITERPDDDSLKLSYVHFLVMEADFRRASAIAKSIRSDELRRAALEHIDLGVNLFDEGKPLPGAQLLADALEKWNAWKVTCVMTWFER